MTEVIKAYPLQWPAGWKRTEPVARKHAQFGKSVHVPSSVPGGSGYSRKGDISVADAIRRIQDELGRMHIIGDNIVISTNLRTRLDGLPRSDQARPADPGAAVYWEDNNVEGWPRRCMAIDIYDRVEHNLAAIAATLDAMRAIARHGGAAILDRAFTGFTALPAPMTAQKPWRDVLEVGPGESGPRVIQEAYRRKRGEAHPDNLETGSHDKFLAVQAAYEQAGRELGFIP